MFRSAVLKNKLNVSVSELHQNIANNISIINTFLISAEHVQKELSSGIYFLFHII